MGVDDRRLAPVVRVVVDDHDLEADVPGRVQDGANAPEHILAAVHVDDDDGELVHALWWVRETSKIPAEVGSAEKASGCSGDWVAPVKRITSA